MSYKGIIKAAKNVRQLSFPSELLRSPQTHDSAKQKHPGGNYLFSVTASANIFPKSKNPKYA
jgi:hypothetical protein